MAENTSDPRPDKRGGNIPDPPPNSDTRPAPGGAGTGTAGDPAKGGNPGGDRK